jgi:hypothetical protein
MEKIDVIDKLCHIILQGHKNPVKNLIKYVTQKNDICIPEFLDIGENVKTRFLRRPDENGETDTEVITYCSLERLSVIIEYKIPAIEMTKYSEKTPGDYTVKSLASFKIIHSGKTQSFCYNGSMELVLILHDEKKEDNINCCMSNKIE